MRLSASRFTGHNRTILVARWPGPDGVHSCQTCMRTLMQHPAFSIRNPNRVRSLVSAFCSGNLAEFHAIDGSGYRFWGEQVLALDAINPQVAARLARALDRWRKFEPVRQAAMHASLTQVFETAQSPDVREVIGKALAEGAGSVAAA